MSKKLYALIIGLVGVACSVTTILMNYFEPSCADQVRAACSMIQPFVAELLLLFTVDTVSKKLKEK